MDAVKVCYHKKTGELLVIEETKVTLPARTRRHFCRRTDGTMLVVHDDAVTIVPDDQPGHFTLTNEDFDKIAKEIVDVE